MHAQLRTEQYTTDKIIIVKSSTDLSAVQGIAVFTDS